MEMKLLKLAEGKTTTKDWLNWFDVSTTDQVGSTDKFHRLIDHADFAGAESYTFSASPGYLTVFSKDRMWHWQTPGGPCVAVGTAYPFVRRPVLTD